MPEYPEYVYKMLARAREEGQWYCGQPDAAALCFDVLALFPDCKEASDLVYELFCDEWLIYNNRVVIQQHIDEWDDRPWQQRRRLALSFRFMSRWEDKYNVRILEGKSSLDVAELLEEGKMELLGAYCLGDEECTDYAWSIFAEAIKKTNDPHAALLWIGWLYADLGFFADAAEALGELCSRFDDPSARRLLAEVVWWRDNAHRIPWIPPAGDGSRYDRIIKSIDPNALTTQEYIERVRKENQRERRAPYRPIINKRLESLFSRSIPEQKNETLAVSLIDWSFLDREDENPGELPDWAKRQIEMLERFKKGEENLEEMIEDIIRRYKFTHNIPPPSTPPRYNPNDLPFDPREIFGKGDEDEEDNLYTE